MACECQYFFSALVESRREEFMSHISPPHWEQRRLVLFLHGHCKLHAVLPGKWWGAVCAIPGVYSECRSRAGGHVGAGKSLGCVCRVPCARNVHMGKCWALCLWFWLMKHRKDESSPVWKYHLLRNWPVVDCRFLLPCGIASSIFAERLG